MMEVVSEDSNPASKPSKPDEVDSENFDKISSKLAEILLPDANANKAKA